jgi:erythronate-4-phosphate dehydrogenase
VKFVGTVTIGTDHVDTDYLAKEGIAFVSAPGSNANSVGEYMASALLELAHSKGFALNEKTIGIVGVGNVGSNVWRKAEALGLKVLLNDPPLQDEGSEYPLHPLDELMRADIMTLHVPLTRSGKYATYHLFDENRIRKMKRGAILINTSRGSVVETKALKKALDETHLAAAVLDVWEGEPNIDTSLLGLVSYGTPHIAGYSLDGKVNALKINYDAVRRFLSLPVDNDIKELIPAPEFTGYSVDANTPSNEETLRNVIKQCYDICTDDGLLRKILLLPKNEQKEYFSALRANYRVRREFFNKTVFIKKGHAESAPNEKGLAETLKLLGFVVKN